MVLLLSLAATGAAGGSENRCAVADKPTLGAARKLPAPPGIVGRIAAETGAGKLVLSHFMARSLNNMKENLKQISSRYSGTVSGAHDLDCMEF